MSNNEKVSRHIHQQNLDKVKWGRMMEQRTQSVGVD